VVRERFALVRRQFAVVRMLFAVVRRRVMLVGCGFSTVGGLFRLFDVDVALVCGMSHVSQGEGAEGAESVKSRTL
jgi:hypothetical protein